MNTNHTFQYRVNFEDEKIEISQSFATAAQKAKTSAHKQLMDLRKAYPGFGISIYKIKPKDSKQKYKHLTFEKMRCCIVKWDGEVSPNLAVLDKAKEDKVPYPKVKKWFLGIYGEHYKRAADITMPVVEETATEDADTAADC